MELPLGLGPLPLLGAVQPEPVDPGGQVAPLEGAPGGFVWSVGPVGIVGVSESVEVPGLVAWLLLGVTSLSLTDEVQAGSVDPAVQVLGIPLDGDVEDCCGATPPPPRGEVHAGSSDPGGQVVELTSGVLEVDWLGLDAVPSLGLDELGEMQDVSVDPGAQVIKLPLGDDCDVIEADSLGFGGVPSLGLDGLGETQAVSVDPGAQVIELLPLPLGDDCEVGGWLCSDATLPPLAAGEEDGFSVGFSLPDKDVETRELSPPGGGDVGPPVGPEILGFPPPLEGFPGIVVLLWLWLGT